jgi:hypothetical protein
MKTYSGSSDVKGGYYLSMRSFGVEVIGEEGGRLPGGPTARYVSVPFPLLFLVVPLAGLAYLMVMPLIGLALLATAGFKRITGHVSEGADALAATVAPPQATGAAYLGGREGEEKNGKVSAEVEKLEKEVADKRKG